MEKREREMWGIIHAKHEWNPKKMNTTTKISCDHPNPQTYTHTANNQDYNYNVN